MSNLVIFGGTFDPVHNGHIRISEAAAKKLDASLIFVPAKSPRWKSPSETPNQRLEMLRLALKDVDFKYEICDYELKSAADVNYSFDTVSYLKTIYPNDKLYFLIGADQVNQFHKWEKGKELSEIAQIVYSDRPNIVPNEENIKDFNMLSLNFLESGDVSSSLIRDMESIDLPFDVLDYIERNRLYYVKKLAEYLPKKRLNHSIEVANLSYKIAKVNNLEPLRHYFIAALFHDLGKTYKNDDENMISIMKNHYSEYLDIPKFAYHQFVGEFLAKRDFNIKEEEILDAIKFHCTGKSNMSNLGMVVYASDKIEPTREFDSTWLINGCMENWKKGFLMTLEDNKKYLLAHNKDITNKLTDECFDMYL